MDKVIATIVVIGIVIALCAGTIYTMSNSAKTQGTTTQGQQTTLHTNINGL